MLGVPMRFRALHGQEVELLAFEHEPDWGRDCPPGLPPDHADLDLAVAGEAVFEVTCDKPPPTRQPLLRTEAMPLLR